MPPPTEAKLQTCLLPVQIDGKTYWLATQGTECGNPAARPLGSEPTPEVGQHGDETADTLGAPAPPVDQGAPALPPADPDPRPLTQQYHDPQNPLPEHGVADAAQAVGTPSEQVPAVVDNVKRNLPPPQQPHPTFGQPVRQGGPIVQDPVLIATGQYELRVTDVVIPGAGGMDLRLDRMYRSGEPWFGPWGWNWDHNYNVYGRELADGGLAVWTGELNEDVYPSRADATYGSPRGVRSRLQRIDGVGPTDRRYLLTDATGVTRILAVPVGYPRSDRFPLVRVEDRYGNGHDLSYDPQGRLQRVADADGRFLRFVYGDCGLLESVVDHTGRQWRYLHDVEVEHLVAVTTPATPDDPDGLATRFEYDRFRTHPALVHGLLRVVDPVGRTSVENEYGTDPGNDDFGRVVRQVYGASEATYAATRLQDVPLVPEAVDVPALRVEVIDPGVLHVYTFNTYGDLLDHRYRLVRDGSMRVLASLWRYDAAGNVVTRWEPDGLGVVMTYDSANLDPRATGNLLTAALVSPPTVVAPSRTIMRCTYDPRHHQLATMTDEAGHVTRLRYDTDTDPAGVGALVSVEHPVATLPDGTPQPCVEHFSYRPDGLLAGHTSAEGRLTRLTYGGLGPGANLLVRRVSGTGAKAETEDYTHDAWGNVAAVTDGSGAQVRHDFDALGRVRSTTRPAVDGVTGDIVYTYGPDGQLVTIDTPAGQTTDVPAGVSTIRQTFVFDVVGQLVETTYAANTSRPRRWRIERDGEGYPIRVTDPVGRVLTVRYDERHLVLDQRIAAGTEVRTVRQRFDRGGRLVASIDAAGRRVDIGYDGWGRVRRADGPGLDGSRTRTTYEYAAGDALIDITVTGDTGAGAAGTLLRVRQSWDERGRLLRRDVGGQSTTFRYDRDELAVAAVDERDGVTSYAYDSVGRLAGTTDAAGNEVRFEHDPRGLVTALVAVEAAGSSRVETVWDARRRLVQGSDDAGTTTIAYDDRDLPVGSVDPSGAVCATAYDSVGDLISTTLSPGDPAALTHRWARDNCGRVTEYTDPSGAVTRWDWTIDDRWSRRTRPSGRVDIRQFDTVGEVSAETAPSGCTVSFDREPDGLISHVRWTPVAGVDAVDDLTIDRDGVGRPVRMTQGATVLRLGWDELGRLIGEDGPAGAVRVHHDDLAGHTDLEYPDGRIDRHVLDELGRVREIRRLAVGAAGLTAYPSGTVLARYGFARDDRINSRELANGTRTAVHHDTVLRTTQVRHTAGATTLADVRYVHDEAGRRRARLTGDVSQGNRLYHYDDSGRITEERRGIAGVASGPAPTPAEQLVVIAQLTAQPGETTSWDVDPAGAPHETRTSTADGQVIEQWTLDADHAPTAVERTDPVGTQLAPVVHDSDGHRTLDARFSYRYDAAGRLVTVSAGGAVLMLQAYDPLGRVVERTVAATTRRTAYLGGTVVEERDAAGVAVRQIVVGPTGDPLLLVSDGTDRFGHPDAHDSLVCVTDAGGAVQARYDYAAFGGVRVLAPDGATALLAPAVAPFWVGHQLLTGVDLYDARGRVYDPATGRFLQRDPRGAVNSADPYAIAGGDPVDLADPTGEIAPIIAAAVIIGAIAGAGYAVYDSVQNPGRYEGAGILKAFGFTFAGAGIGWLSALASTAVGGAATVGLGGSTSAAGGASAAAAGGGFALLSWQGFAITAVEAGVGGTVWRAGFHELFPELEDAPSLRTLGVDMASGGVLRGAGPVLKRIIPTAVWNSAEVAVRETGYGLRLAWQGLRQGQWRAFGSEIPLVRRDGLIAVRRWFWEERTFGYKSKRYWDLAPNRAAGKDLGHTLLSHSASRQPLPERAEGFRNAGFNLLELPKGLNHWLGRYVYREDAMRHALLGTLTATGLGAAALTHRLLYTGMGGPGDAPWASPFVHSSLAAPSAPPVTVHSPRARHT